MRGFDYWQSTMEYGLWVWEDNISKLSKSKIIKNNINIILSTRHTCRWLYKIKEDDVNSDKPWFKVRLLAKDFTHVEEVYYNEVFSTMMKNNTMRIMLALVIMYNLK